MYILPQLSKKASFIKEIIVEKGEKRSVVWTLRMNDTQKASIFHVFNGVLTHVYLSVDTKHYMCN